MPTDNFSQFISKKSYEICYAVFRVALSLKRGSIANHLEDQGLSLLESAASGDYERALSSSRSLEYLIRMGSDVNIINVANSDLICGELQQINSAIAGLDKSANPLPVDISDVFSKPPAVAADQETNQYNQIFKDADVAVDIKPEPSQLEADLHGFDGISGGGGMVKAAIRQSAILERIRQSGNCRIKDLQDYFKDISERTIRYDIQGLIEKGLVDRLNGGPLTSYKAKEPQSYESNHTNHRSVGG